ncbi:MAG: baseplate J/gp47 family protein [Nitrososphaerales archaeon]
MAETVFRLPTEPQEFGVVLPPAELRRINFSALDFSTIRRALIEYIKSYFPNDFNDFVASNGAMMFMELIAAVGNILSLRSDILVAESFLPTCQTKEAVINHLRLINQQIRRATPAVVDVEISLANPAPTSVSIPAGLRINIAGADGLPLFYELYRAPGDFKSNIVIPPGKRGVIAFGIEGRFADPIIAESAGGPDQTIDIVGNNILDDPFIVEVSTGGEIVEYKRVTNIERYGPNDAVFEVRFSEGKAAVIFGDNITGKAPLAGQTITVRYRVGGGVRGRIGSNVINETRSIIPEAPASAPVEVLIRNISPSSGGTDEESLEEAKTRAPKDAATLNSATTGEDYAQLAKTFSHPVFGSVIRAVATLRTGVEGDLIKLAERVRSARSVSEAVEILNGNFINRNIVELYVLAEGPDRIPVKPSMGLKLGLQQFFEQLAVLTDEVRVLDGEIKPVNFRANVIISRSADAGTVREAVSKAVDDFFDVSNFDMGQPLYLSHLYETIQSVPGVKFVTIFSPPDDILPTKKLASANMNGVGINELITLGEKNIQFYFERGAADR